MYACFWVRVWERRSSAEDPQGHAHEVRPSKEGCWACLAGRGGLRECLLRPQDSGPDGERIWRDAASPLGEGVPSQQAHSPNVGAWMLEITFRLGYYSMLALQNPFQGSGASSVSTLTQSCLEYRKEQGRHPPSWISSCPLISLYTAPSSHFVDLLLLNPHQFTRV